MKMGARFLAFAVRWSCALCAFARAAFETARGSTFSHSKYLHTMFVFTHPRRASIQPRLAGPSLERAKPLYNGIATQYRYATVF